MQQVGTFQLLCSVLQIQEMLAERFGDEKICDSVNPDEVVAFGAGIQAAGSAGLTEATLIDVASHSLGLKAHGDVMVCLLLHAPFLSS